MASSQTSNADSLAFHTAREIRAEMARQGISQEALGERIGWDQRRVSRRLTAEVPIDLEELERIAEALGVPVSKFIPDAAPARVA